MNSTLVGVLVVPFVLGVAACDSGADEADPASTTSSSTPTVPGTSKDITGGVTGSPVDWLTAVCPQGAYQGIEVTPDGRGGPDALNEGWTCTAVSQADATTYLSVELFSYAADPTAYWQEQADESADSYVYFAVGRTQSGWVAFVEDDSRSPIGDLVISAAGELGFELHLDG